MSLPQPGPTDENLGYKLASLTEAVDRQGDALYRIEKFITGNGDPKSGMLYRLAQIEEREAEARKDAERRNNRVTALVTAALVASTTSLVGLGIKILSSGSLVSKLP